MPASSSGAVEKRKSPFPVEAVQLTKDSVRHSGSRRGSAASWLHPLSSTEVPDSDLPHNPLFSRHGVQLTNSDDIVVGGGGAGSSSLLSATEISPMRIREASGRKSGLDSSSITSSSKREVRSCRGYARLTGLLTRRGGEGKSSKNVAVSSTSHSTTTCSGGAPQGTVIASLSSAATRNPLQRSCNTSGEADLSEEIRLDDGGCDWPSTPSPKTASVSHRCGSNSPSGAVGVVPWPSAVNSTIHSRSRRELCASPLASQSSRPSPHATLRLDGGSATNGAGLDSSGAQFVPLGSSDLANRNGSPNRLQRSYCGGVDDDKTTTSSTLRNRSLRQKLISGSSLSTSASQSLLQVGSTRASQGQTPRNTGDPDASVHLSKNARSLRDAKAALLRRTQHGAAHSLRSSRTHSFRRSQSNASTGGGDPLSQRGSRMRPSSREKRSTNSTKGALAGGGRVGSAHSIAAVEDDVVRISVRPAGLNSPLTHWDIDFPLTTAVPDMGSGKSEHNICVSGAQRRFSRPEDNPLLEVMETSSCASQGWYEAGNGAPWCPSTAEQATRSRIAVAAGSLSKSMERRTTGLSRDGSPFQKSSSTRRGTFYPPRMPSGFHSLSPNGGYSSSTDSEEEIRLRERHRNRVDEVLRQLNAPMKSTTVDDGLVAASMRNNSSYPSARDASVGADASQIDNNNSSAWVGIGGLDWDGGLVAFCASTTGGGNANMSTTVNANGGGGGDGGGWHGVGGAATTEDWYARMRKRLEEEEKAEAVAAAVIARDANFTSAAPPSESAPTHSPATTSGNRNKDSTPSEMHMPAIDRATACNRPLPLLRSTRSTRAPSAPPAHSSLPPGESQTAPPMLNQTSKPKISPGVSSTGERFVRRPQPPGIPARMQLSHTCAALGSADGGAATTHPHPPEASGAKEDSAAARSPSKRLSLKSTAVTVPVNAAESADSAGAAPSPELEVMEPHHRLSAFDPDDGSVSGMSGTSTVAPLMSSASRQLSEKLIAMPSTSASMVDTSHSQSDLRRHCSLPRIVPKVSMTVLKPSPPGQHPHSTIATSVPSRVHNGVRLTLVPSSAAAQSSGGSSATPTREVPVSGVGATTRDSVCTGADVNGGLRCNPSAPTLRQGTTARKQPTAGARSTENPTSSSGAPAVVLTSARLSDS
ncbi:conserved hypothetical protein [Leishmania major strain Friedlin]|uniref:Uncharacterized protein n=1 Tax=Leishmania major TaxID=5664 RepID=Q4QDI4_LEIMA|nr:conserved hypothetical protein [Leishmania major strain Friedlin]CAG9572724.1 hypothetical_protein_-_conserved [Leishmania major strain Friedlin]CAJ07122.1 conserved hypothetical protein [Leishmania major strain Friedlin]|eukprot:XP_001682614.1 conserved hypothetical protein [Leishmania major strain Friedlin]